jgi:O-antigen ligase
MIRKIQDFLLYSYLFSINFQELQLFDFVSLSIPKIIAFLYLLFVLPDINSFLNIEKIRSFIVPLIVFFIYLSGINIINITVDSYSFFDFGLFINLVLFWLITVHFSRNDIVPTRALFYLAFGSIFLSLLYFFDIGVLIDDNGRTYLFNDNPNFVGIKMSISIIVLLFVVVQNNLNLNLLRYILLLPVFLMLALLNDTGSRVSLISLILMLLTGLFFIRIPGRMANFFLVIIIFGFFYYLINLVLDNPLLLLRLSSSVENNDIAGRDVIFSDIWDVVKNEFLLGIGQTGYFAKFGNGSPHNVLLEIFTYAGVFGLLLYVYFLCRMLKTALRSLAFERNILPVILLIPLFGLILSGQILTLKLGWVLFSYIASRIYFVKPRLCLK